MLPAYCAAPDPQAAIARAAALPHAAYIAGGTDLLQLMEEAVVEPAELVDISRLPLAGIATEGETVRIGALTRLADAADDPLIRERLPVIAEALAETASPQVRNMATIGGNLLQRTRCLYFRDAATPCNKRVPGTGCPAQDGRNRMNAILGGSAHCIAVHPSDLAVALVALDAMVEVSGPGGARSIPIGEFHRLPGDTPHVETALEPGDLVTAVAVPMSAAGGRSRYLKVRDRASFEWALASAAVVLRLDGGCAREVRVAVGGVATRPWRLPRVEALLEGRALDADLVRAAGELAVEGAEARGENAFKIPLLKATVVRALADAAGLVGGPP